MKGGWGGLIRGTLGRGTWQGPGGWGAPTWQRQCGVLGWQVGLQAPVTCFRFRFRSLLSRVWTHWDLFRTFNPGFGAQWLQYRIFSSPLSLDYGFTWENQYYGLLVEPQFSPFNVPTARSTCALAMTCKIHPKLTFKNSTSTRRSKADPSLSCFWKCRMLRWVACAYLPGIRLRIRWYSNTLCSISACCSVCAFTPICLDTCLSVTLKHSHFDTFNNSHVYTLQLSHFLTLNLHMFQAQFHTYTV